MVGRKNFRDGLVNLVEGGGGREWKSDFWAILYFAAIIGLQFLFWECAVQFFL